jgi:predicted nuclease of predicted toxin-antitoxin system
MKLLFDQNLSYRLCAKLHDIFPDSSQVRLLGLDRRHDDEICNMHANMVLPLLPKTPISMI